MTKALDIAVMALPNIHGLLTEDDRREITVGIIREYLRALQPQEHGLEDQETRIRIEKAVATAYAMHHFDVDLEDRELSDVVNAALWELEPNL